MTLKFKILSYVMEGNKTGADIMQEFGISRNQFYDLKNKLTAFGLPLIYDPSTRTYSVNYTARLTPEEMEVVRRIGRMGLSRSQIDGVLDVLQHKRIPKERREVVFSKNRIKFVIISDIHSGSEYCREDIVRRAAYEANMIGADFVLNGGDSVEGMSGRPDQLFDLDLSDGIGITPQAKKLASMLGQFGEIPVYSIEARGSHGGWAMYNSRGAPQGADVGELLEMYSRKYGAGLEEWAEGGGQYRFLGFNKADFYVNGVRIRLIHPKKQTGKNYVKGLTGSQKPHVLIVGHWHSVAKYEIHRNVHIIECGTAQETTPFIEGQGNESILGYWICEMVIGEGPTDQTELVGPFVESFSARFVSFYSKGVL